MAGQGTLTTDCPPSPVSRFAGHPRGNVWPTKISASPTKRRSISSERPPRQDRDHADQAADHPARPVAGLFARRRRPLPAHPGRPGPPTTTPPGNLVAVISNGTAVLGLGNLGALAAKPVMEGKAVLFKRFADIDGIDLEVDTKDVDEFVNCVRLLRADLRRHQPRGHQGAGVLHHRAAPARADGHPGVPRRPARHRDHRRRRADQRAAPDRPPLADIRMVVNGAGAAAIACVELLKAMGMPHGNVMLCDTKGVIYQGRTDGMNQWKSAHAVATEARTLAEAHRRRRRVPRPVGQGRVHAGDGRVDGGRSRSSSPWPTPTPRSRPRRCAPSAPTRSSPPAAPTTRTRSTTSWASPTSSAARSTCAPPPSTRR